MFLKNVSLVAERPENQRKEGENKNVPQKTCSSKVYLENERRMPMLNRDPVKIPNIPGRISFRKNGVREYVSYLADRKYNQEKKYSEPERIIIGRKIKDMPSLMYPNDNYDELFGAGKTDAEDEEMTMEEDMYIRNNGVYGMYIPFFEGLYHEFKQQMRRKADEPVNPYKAESINKVLRPLQEMMKDEEYSEFLGLIETRKEGEKETEMSYSDVMILLTQYKSALGKYHRNHR